MLLEANFIILSLQKKKRKKVLISIATSKSKIDYFP